MSWAEFVIRSISFKEEREFQMKMTREVAYQSYRMQFLFSKGNPVSKERFWSIGKNNEPIEVSDEMKKRFMSQMKEFQNNKK